MLKIRTILDDLAAAGRMEAGFSLIGQNELRIRLGNTKQAGMISGLKLMPASCI